MDLTPDYNRPSRSVTPVDSNYVGDTALLGLHSDLHRRGGGTGLSSGKNKVPPQRCHLVSCGEVAPGARSLRFPDRISTLESIPNHSSDSSLRTSERPDLLSLSFVHCHCVTLRPHPEGGKSGPCCPGHYTTFWSRVLFLLPSLDPLLPPPLFPSLPLGTNHHKRLRTSHF